MGGGAFRTAAKAASDGAPRSSHIDETTGMAPRHQVAAISSSTLALDSGLSVPFLSSEKEHTESPSAASTAHCPAWKIDGRKLAGRREEEEFGLVNTYPRKVFGPAPTLEEARDATSDLKEALEEVYSQPNLLNSHECGQISVSYESSTVSTIPEHVAQMFSLLQGSTDAQVVATSLASDKSVWEAVMKNGKVIQFCKNLPPKPSPSPESEETSKGPMFEEIMNNFKVRVSGMASNLSDFLQDSLRISPGNSSSMGGVNTTVKTAEAYTDITVGASFVALAVATIVVVLLKRG